MEDAETAALVWSGSSQVTLRPALVYNWHRTYDPYTGRYLEPDPLNLGVAFTAEATLRRDFEAATSRLPFREEALTSLGPSPWVSGVPTAGLAFAAHALLRQPAIQHPYIYGLNSSLVYVDLTGLRVVDCESNFDCVRRNYGALVGEIGLGGIATHNVGRAVGSSLVSGAGAVAAAGAAGFLGGIWINCASGVDTFPFTPPPPDCCAR
jgi:hypothetical protein